MTPVTPDPTSAKAAGVASTSHAAVATLCVLAILGGGLRPCQAAQYTAWQEIVLLTCAKVQHAASHCGFQSDPGQIGNLLASAEVDSRDLDKERTSSGSLARQIAADEDAYRGDADLACARAWDRFGPDGAPGIRDLLRR